MSCKTIAVLGAGSRGMLFGQLMAQMPHLGRVVAVAEPRDNYRQAFSQEHQVPAERQFRSWHDFLAQPKVCDGVVIATMDREHVEPAVACLRKGYDVLLEKPMAVTLEDCQAIEAAQRETGRILGVCHSLRYQKGFRTVKELVAGGAVGEIVTLDMIEQVSYWHQAHSFVRGKWGNQGRATFMLLAKSCHDIDYLCYLVGQPCQRVASYGGLKYFKPEHAPQGSTMRCTDPCPVEPKCPYSAIRQYVEGDRHRWPADVVSLDHSREAHLAAIRTGPFGRCVWKCDNDVVDHQVVLFEFAQNITATFTMTGFTQGNGRRLRVHGTEGELEFEESKITIKTFADRNVQTISLGEETGGHGGGDVRVMREWLLAMHSGNPEGVVANAQESLRTHTVVFAAEKSRLEGRMVEIAEVSAAQNA